MIDPSLPEIARETADKLWNWAETGHVAGPADFVMFIEHALSTLLRQQQEAMQPYVQHKSDCKLLERRKWMPSDMWNKCVCTCGLDAIVQRTAVSG